MNTSLAAAENKNLRNANKFKDYMQKNMDKIRLE